VLFSNDAVDGNGNKYSEASWQYWLFLTVTVCCAPLVMPVYQFWRMTSENRPNSVAEKRLKPMRKRLAAGKESFEKDIIATVRRSWQNVVEYRSKLYLSATYYGFINWEPRVPEGKTRVRWNCVSLSS
jgi:hypothetical protein